MSNQARSVVAIGGGTVIATTLVQDKEPNVTDHLLPLENISQMKTPSDLGMSV